MDGVKTLEDTVTAVVAEADGLPTEASIRQLIQRVRDGAVCPGDRQRQRGRGSGSQDRDPVHGPRSSCRRA